MLSFLPLPRVISTGLLTVVLACTSWLQRALRVPLVRRLLDTGNHYDKAW